CAGREERSAAAEVAEARDRSVREELVGALDIRDQVERGDPGTPALNRQRDGRQRDEKDDGQPVGELVPKEMRASSVNGAWRAVEKIARADCGDLSLQARDHARTCRRVSGHVPWSRRT